MRVREDDPGAAPGVRLDEDGEAAAGRPLCEVLLRGIDCQEADFAGVLRFLGETEPAEGSQAPKAGGAMSCKYRYQEAERLQAEGLTVAQIAERMEVTAGGASGLLRLARDRRAANQQGIGVRQLRDRRREANEQAEKQAGE